MKSVLDRVPNWPQEKQRALAAIALEIEAEIVGAPYDATADELRAIDEGLADEAATEDEIRAAFAAFQPSQG